MSNAPKYRNFTTPPGRFVSGNCYTPQTKDADGKPLIIKNGPDTGKPTQKFTVAIAIAKIPGAHWGTYPRDPKRPDQESWGEAIWNAGCSDMGNAAQAPTFAWKITDGDSQIPNRKGRKPCDQEGFPGNWVVWCSGSFAPKCYNADGSAALLEKDAVKPGYFIQIAGTVGGNMSTQNPGVFINPSLVSLQGFGPEIISGPDASAVGFGGAPLPAGASAVPVAAFAPPAIPGAPPAPPAAGYAPLPPAVPVVPNPAFLAPPGVNVAPFPPAASAPPPPPAPPARQMLPAAGAHTYDALKAAGWTDEAMRAARMMA